ncbi:RluA family pseudouridine synthase [Pseudobacteriovorax antillogorgiicola]|uniref:23S rRNA pseudouridine1911/1915/1917 synthase n=1 Tax=Pseudobacteriovorax antillogorgiicola TaxID=1513793 RepID=A0A1Y6CHS6_9BACT|nr:RluA family pseudouridine synthase [Pseudobacteriovorax antillogorgiicola]TCS48645.1 23S rRNA pseudouridine1911/1915/1917 synthase [Pseudobacteriovorax antillogorgiicola]SMF55262.1 23S rRNA pseudouridine1911/1915/1917 synthase [Pseudobacteriovorax antillogorgiicola]
MPPTKPKIDRSSGEFRPLGPPVKEDHVGLRADGYLSTHFPFYSRATWQKRMRNGLVIVDGRPIKASYRLSEGQIIQIYHPQVAEPDVDRDIYPLWKQGSVMAVYKPGNLPMHENGPYRKNTFAYFVKQDLGDQWAAVHRLDRETSGIVLCGSSLEVRHELSRSLADRVLEKEYLAIARGEPKKDAWVESGPIADLDSSEIRIKKWVLPHGLPSETHFKVLDTKGEYVLLRARPKTGRTNQIRIHAAYNGLPLVGDMLYHPDEDVFLEWFEHGRKTDRVIEQIGFRRCLLHAASLTFLHPETNQEVTVRCPMPEDMQKFWDTLPKN